jgi:hypothetical protein
VRCRSFYSAGKSALGRAGADFVLSKKFAAEFLACSSVLLSSYSTCVNQAQIAVHCTEAGARKAIR